MTKDLSIAPFIEYVEVIYLFPKRVLERLTVYRLVHLITYYVTQAGQEITKSCDLILLSPRINIMLSCPARTKYRE